MCLHSFYSRLSALFYLNFLKNLFLKNLTRPKIDEKRIVNRKLTTIEENYKIIKYFDSIDKNNENDLSKICNLHFCLKNPLKFFFVAPIKCKNRFSANFKKKNYVHYYDIILYEYFLKNMSTVKKHG